MSNPTAVTEQDLTTDEAKALVSVKGSDKRKPNMRRVNGFLCVSFGRPGTRAFVDFARIGTTWCEVDSPYANTYLNR